ncbi:MAG: hypothetical protein J2P36_08270 [Ktedonobacteraceae bacterium]|nr:hypothetical protein [Ktedonobacteraceae bacterium]
MLSEERKTNIRHDAGVIASNLAYNDIIMGMSPDDEDIAGMAGAMFHLYANGNDITGADWDEAILVFMRRFMHQYKVALPWYESKRQEELEERQDNHDIARVEQRWHDQIARKLLDY